MRYVLLINTTQNNNINIAIKDNDNIINEKNIPARRIQAEVLLIEIDKLLKKNKINKKSLKKIKVANTGGSFTSLRIGVITANALGYGLGIKVESQNSASIKNNKTTFSVVEPIYNN